MDDDGSADAGGTAADLSVLDELITDVQGDAGSDSPEFFDTADMDDEGGDFTADDVLRQLDTVTRLSDSEDNEMEGHNSTVSTESPSSGPLQAAAEADVAVEKDADQELDEDSDDSGAKPEEEAVVAIPTETPEADDDEPSPVEGRESAVDDDVDAEDAIQADASEFEDLDAHSDDGTPGTGDGSTLETAASPSSELSEVREEPVDDSEVHGVYAGGEAIDNKQDADQPPPPIDDSNEHAATLPPPAPATTTIVMSGSMVPEADDNSDSDSDDDADANGEGDIFSPPPGPVLPISDSVDMDDDDELEVDPAVSSTIEPASRASMKVSNDPVAFKIDVSGSEDVSIGFGDEIRVAAVVVESELASEAVGSLKGKKPGSFEAVRAAKQQERTSKEEDVAFGIAYQSSKPRLSASPVEHGDDYGDDYTLSKAPAFPDEKEFEHDMEIDSGGSFSTSNARLRVGCGPKDDDGLEDDEFRFEEGDAPVEVAAFSAEELEARRASLAARKAQEEAKLLEELKRATDDERRMIECAEAAEQQQKQTPVDSVSSTETDTSLSLGELHSMYKRGLGDQSVHFLDEAAGGTGEKIAGPPGAASEAAKPSSAPPQRLSVMGRLLSKPRALTDVIVEAENEDEEREGDEDGDSQEQGEMAFDDATSFGVRSDQQTLLGCGDDDQYDDEDVGGGEWKEIQLTDKVVVMATADDGASPQPSPLKPAQQQWRISYTESAGYFAEAPEFLAQRDRIVPEDFPARTSCFSCLSRPRLAFPGAVEERDRVFCVAATAFDPANDVFCRMLQTFYARLIPSTTGPALIGGHWERVGFQGSDPATDLRGVGVLALLQMLHLVESHGELARRLHSLSQHSTRHFPFACALINATLQSLVALRSGALYPECNKHASVVAGINLLFVALCSELAAELAATEDAVPLVLKRVLDRGRLDPIATISAVFDAPSSALGVSSDAVGASYASTGAPASPPSPASPRSRPSASTNVEFTEIALHSVADD